MVIYSKSRMKKLKLQINKVKLVPCMEEEVTGSSSDCARTKSIDYFFACARTTPYSNIAWRSIAGSKIDLVVSPEKQNFVNTASTCDSYSISDEIWTSSSTEALSDVKITSIHKDTLRYSSTTSRIGRIHKR